MGKQDYEALAALIRVNRSYIAGDPTDRVVRDVLDNLARDMADYLGRNATFDPKKFLAAAGVS